MGKLAVADALVSSWYDYGPFHLPTLGFGIHMAEGSNTAAYLDNIGRAPSRGVSTHFVIELTGRIVQMLDITHASGNLNPADRASEKDYYKGSILRAVLGDYWTDPNAVSIQIEMEGFAAQGPNPAQRASVVLLVGELRRLVPTLRGAFGHADQTDTKGCPGTTLAMRSLFLEIGGHGLWGEPMPLPITSQTPMLIDAPAGPRYDLDGKTLLTASGIALAGRYSPYGAGTTFRAVYGSVQGLSRLMLVKPSATHPIPAPVPDPALLKATFNDGVQAAATAAATARKA